MPHVGAKKLHEAVEASDELLRPFREQYAEAIEAYGGRHWGDGKRRKRQVVNLGNRYVKTLVAHLAAGNPEHTVRARTKKLRAHAALTQLALDHLAEEQNWYKTSRTVLKMALLGPCAFLRIGLKAGQNIHTIDGMQYDLGQPFAVPVSLDDLIVDPAARCREERLYEGYRYRPYRSSLYNARAAMTRYGKSVIDTLPSLEDGTRLDSERFSERVSNDLSANDRFGAIDAVELIDVVIRDGDGRFHICTLSSDPAFCDDYLMTREWEGPECGPLLCLEFDDQPDQPFGVPPVVTAREQGELANALLVKLANQFERLKTILAYKPGFRDEANHIRKARDGETIPMRDPDAVRAYEMGAVNVQMMPMVQLLRGLADEAQGNVSILSGGKGGGDTATEYSGQQANASVLIEDMHRIHERFETERSRAMAWWLHTDPAIQLPMVKRMPGGEYLDLVYSADQREGDWLDYNISVRTNSMSSHRHDPQVHARRIIELIGVAMQAAEVSASTGGLVDLGGTMRVLSREMNVDELDEIIGDPMFQMEREAFANAMPQFDGQGMVRGMSVTPGRGPTPGRGAGTSNRYTTDLGTTRGALSIMPGLVRGAA